MEVLKVARMVARKEVLKVARKEVLKVGRKAALMGLTLLALALVLVL